MYFSIQADPDVAFRELQSGSIDFAMIPTGQIQDTIDQYGLSDDGFTVTPGKQCLTGTELSTYYLVVNFNDPVLSNAGVRRGISYAINRQNIVDTLYEGYREAANSIMPLSIDDNEQNVWAACTYDPEKAAEELDAARLPRGRGRLPWHQRDAGLQRRRRS